MFAHAINSTMSAAACNSSTDGRRSPTSASCSGTVRTATYLGASTEYEIDTAWGGVLKAFAQNLSEIHRARPGEQVTVSWDAGHGFLLPSTTDTVPESAPVTSTARTVA